MRPLLPAGIPLNDTAVWADEAALHGMMARLRQEALIRRRPCRAPPWRQPAPM